MTSVNPELPEWNTPRWMNVAAVEFAARTAAVRGGSIVQANKVAVDAAKTNRGNPSSPRTTGAMTGERMPFVNGLSTGGAWTPSTARTIPRRHGRGGPGGVSSPG